MADQNKFTGYDAGAEAVAQRKAEKSEQLKRDAEIRRFDRLVRRWGEEDGRKRFNAGEQY